MTIAHSLLPEFEHEMQGARATLERLPEDQLDFKPHEKSMSLGRLAGHIAEIPTWIQMTLEVDELDLAPGGEPAFEAFTAPSRQAALERFDAGVEAARDALAATPDEAFMVNWALKSDGQVYFEMPRAAVYRSFGISHLVHHRAQLGVYYRLVGVAVPSLYGPSADEGVM